MPQAMSLGRVRALTIGAGLALTLGVTALPFGGLPAQASLDVVQTRAVVIRTLYDPDITESSGLARSAFSDRRLWTHNDSGGGTAIYAINQRGRTAATFWLDGASHLDWEAMARATRNGVSFLYLADIGDNAKRRSTIAVHRVREPRLSDSRRTLNPATFTFRYPDGPHDAETLLVRPGTNRIFIVSKGEVGRVYVAPRTLTTRRVMTLRSLCRAPSYLTDGVFLDRERLVLRQSGQAHLYRKVCGRHRSFDMPHGGESITAAWRSGAVLVGHEGYRSDIWRVRLP